MITWQHIWAFCIFVILLLILLAVAKPAWGWV
jgi:hypothetical protein